MTIKEICFIQERQKNFMPQYMKDLEKDFNNVAKPSKNNLSKKYFIQSWLKIFDSSLTNPNNELINKFETYTILQLEQAFEFTINNFAELDLGGNMKWYSFSIETLTLISSSNWNKVTKCKI